jgi:nitric oxide reductase NorQ protein
MDSSVTPIIIDRLPSDAYKAQKDLKYVDVTNMHGLFDKMATRQASLVLVGPKGVGKTLSVASWAAKNDWPIVTFDCSEDVRRSQLLGMYVLRGQETAFILGPIPTAFEIANEVGRCILCLEEINGLTPQMQKVLNAPTDFRRKVEVPECKRVFALKPGAQLWVVGSMNTSNYGGVFQLNEDLKSRLRLLEVSYPIPEHEKQIVMEVLGNLADTTLVGNVLLLAQETRQKSTDYAMSTRDVFQLLEDADTLGVKPALKLILSKFEGDDRTTVAARIQSIFGLNLQ